MIHLDLPIFLDIETSWERRITIVGFWSEATGMQQLVAPEVAADTLLGMLPPEGTLVTFNGHAFDLPVIAKETGLNLRSIYPSVDLMYECRSLGLRGGQKKIEVLLGLSRDSQGFSGIDAMNHWRQWHEWGDEEALKRLLHYNVEDVLGMKAIVEYLNVHGWHMKQA